MRKENKGKTRENSLNEIGEGRNGLTVGRFLCDKEGSGEGGK